ncbi:MAG: hypothetical protein JW767_08040, partial [Thermoleophilia bacterium]|nr:hypothetical protein [Thermoleophilia bacterium]
MDPWSDRSPAAKRRPEEVRIGERSPTRPWAESTLESGAAGPVGDDGEMWLPRLRVTVEAARGQARRGPHVHAAVTPTQGGLPERERVWFGARVGRCGGGRTEVGPHTSNEESPMRVREIVERIDRLAPFELAESWDHVGLQV